MKTIKFLMMALMMCFTMVSFGQTDKIVNEKFQTVLESGVGEKILFTFTISTANVEKIKNSKCFKMWDSTMFKTPANILFAENYKDSNRVELYLTMKTHFASISTKHKLKNSASYTPISTGEGMIYVDENGNDITIYFPFKAQNGYGNFIFSKSFYTIKWDGIKKEVIEKALII
jgi:hypothetical protein